MMGFRLFERAYLFSFSSVPSCGLSTWNLSYEPFLSILLGDSSEPFRRQEDGAFLTIYCSGLFSCEKTLGGRSVPGA